MDDADADAQITALLEDAQDGLRRFEKHQDKTWPPGFAAQHIAKFQKAEAALIELLDVRPDDDRVHRALSIIKRIRIELQARDDLEGRMPEPR